MDNQHRQIKGYGELSQEDIDAMNHVKTLGTTIGEVIERMEISGKYDGRWLSIAKTDLQKGFMSLTRSIAQPEFF